MAVSLGTGSPAGRFNFNQLFLNLGLLFGGVSK